MCKYIQFIEVSANEHDKIHRKLFEANGQWQDKLILMKSGGYYKQREIGETNNMHNGIMRLYSMYYKTDPKKFEMEVEKMIHASNLWPAKNAHNEMMTNLLYEGKAKKIFLIDDPNKVIMYFKDDATAGNGAKESTFEGKGVLNCSITTKIFNKLNNSPWWKHLADVPTHYIQTLSDREILVKKVDIIPVEVVIRNRASGTFCKRYGIKNGTELKQPVIEYCVKDDALNDPLIGEDAILALGLCTKNNLYDINTQAKYIRVFLTKLMKEIGFELIDFKLEFGIDTNGGKVILADEICPDTMRLWEDGKSFDKDLFRLNTGDLLAGYREVERRLINHTEVAESVWSR